MNHDNLIDFSDLPHMFGQNRQRTQKMRNFAEEVEKAMAVKSADRFRSKDEKINSLDAIVEKGVDKLESSQLMRLYSAYRDLAAFDKMIDLYKKAVNEDFKKAPMVREQLAVAYRKVPREGGIPNKMYDYIMSQRISNELIIEGYDNGVSYENIGRIKRYIAQNNQDGDAWKFKKASVLAFETGFSKTLESSVGIQAIHGNIILGRIEKARETAKVVFLATLRDGAEETNDYFCVSAALQAACIAGESKEVINHLCGRLESVMSYTWELNDIRRDLERIAKDFPSENLRNVRQRLEVASQLALPIAVMENGQEIKTNVITFMPELIESKFNTNHERCLTEDPKLKAVLEKSYSYRGCGSTFRGANRVDGNMKFGGQLPDHAVSRKDLRLFAGLVQMSPNELGVKFDKPVAGIDMDKPLTELQDPELFMRVADRFIRQAFSTENFANSGLHMENNAFEKNERTGESLYDTTVKSILRATGKKIGDADKLVDSRTNISAIFALGLGDCRHHAQVKQIMFDMWQKKQMDDVLKNMYDHVLMERGVKEDDPDKAKFYNILDTELRTADVQVRMPVIMNQKPDKEGVMQDQLYSPAKTDDGKYVVDQTGKEHALEEHTLCWMIRKNREQKLVGFGIRDAFYQQLHYKWENMDVDVSKIKLDENGNPQIPAGFVPGEKTSTGKPIEVCQHPASYNRGKRDSFIKDSIGRDVCLVGVPLAGFATPVDFLNKIKDREKMFNIMGAVRIQNVFERDLPVKKNMRRAVLKLYARGRKDKENPNGQTLSPVLKAAKGKGMA